MERRAGQDSSAARVCHGSEDEFLSNAEYRKKCADSDVDMGDIGAVEDKLPGSAVSATSVGVRRHNKRNISGQLTFATSGSASSPIQITSPALSQRTLPVHGMGSRFRFNHVQAISVRSSSSARGSAYYGSYTFVDGIEFFVWSWTRLSLAPICASASSSQ